MKDLIIVSNRGPFSFSPGFLDGARNALDHDGPLPPIGFGQGGLVQAMAGLLKSDRWNTTWLGSSMGHSDIDVARGHFTDLFRRMRERGHAPDRFPYIEIEPDGRMRFQYRDYDFHLRFVFFDTQHMHSYYSKFANGFLWPLFHLTRSPVFYKTAQTFPRPEFEKNSFVQYVSSGVTFANTIIDELSKTRSGGDSVVWIQDYHLMRAAEFYRSFLDVEDVPPELAERTRVGQFMHTPLFNIHDIQGLIRQDKRGRVKAQVFDPFAENIETALQKLIWGMLFNDFIGFHTKEYCDNYLEALEEWFPVDIQVNGNFYEVVHQDRVTTIGPLPIGLDVDTILAESDPAKPLDHQWDGRDLQESIDRDRREGRIIFGGLERCDYTKGLVERLDIFKHAQADLSTHEMAGRFYQVTAPSRSANPDYQYLNKVLAERTEEINQHLEGRPVYHLDSGVPSPENYRFMREVDVMFVTPLEDGMNLVAFEYILSQKFKDPDRRGLLALSTSGASRLLKHKGFGEADGVVTVNPLKAKDAGQGVARAVRAGRRISDRLIEYVEKERRVDDWAQQNIDAILNCRQRI